MRKNQIKLLLFTISIACFFSSLTEGIFLFNRSKSYLPVVISTSKQEYFHYEFVDIKVEINNAKIRKELENRVLYALIYKDGKQIKWRNKF